MYRGNYVNGNVGIVGIKLMYCGYKGNVNVGIMGIIVMVMWVSWVLR